MNHLNNLKDQTVLITGSTDGIGKQTAVDLAEMGAKVIVHGRNEGRVKETMQEIFELTGNNNLDFVIADLSSLQQVQEMADDLHQRFNKIDVLINNAGVFKTTRELNEDGFEMTFVINHLSYFLLTNLILDLIKNSDYKRIVNVASQAHNSDLDFDNLHGEKYYEGYDAYARSKLCNIMFTYTLSRKLQGTGITANVLHPGVISTKLLHEGFGMGGAPINSGSKTSAYLAFSEEVKDVTGKYFVSQRESSSSQISYNVEVQEQLWELSEKMTGNRFQI